MSEKVFSKIIAIFLAFVFILSPVTVQANAKDGLVSQGDHLAYYQEGQLVKSKGIRVDNGLYYADDEGDIVAEIILQAGDEYKIVEKQAGYMNAYHALSKTNAVSQVMPGNYYIYKLSKGAINISRVKNAPGSWILIEENQANLEKQFEGMNLSPKKKGMSVGKTYDLKANAKGYLTAHDAVNDISPRTQLLAGTYHVFKVANGAMNLSKVNGQAGSWVALDQDLNTEALVTPNTQTQDAKKSEKEDKPLKVGDRYTLDKNVSGYMNAGYALTGENPITNVSPGQYYVFNIFRGAINISTAKNKPGSWINPNDLGDSQKLKDNPTIQENAPLVIKKGDEYRVTKTLPGFFNSIDAKKQTNSNSRVSPGTYYVFTTATNGAINISASANYAGFWILPDSPVVTGTQENTAEKNQSNIKPDTKPDTKNFTFIIDPGHGAGAMHNRGGLLFNEGDQNYHFAQKLIAEANKYQNVQVITTRPNIGNDPSLIERAGYGEGADLFLSLHTNAAPISLNTKGVLQTASNIRGVEVYSSHASQNTSMAYDISNMVSTTLSTPNRGVKYRSYNGSYYGRPVAGASDYYGVFRHSNTAKTKYLIEFVFHTNLQDSQAYLDNQDALAQNLMQIIANNYNLIKK